jgi:MuDR family transposase
VLVLFFPNCVAFREAVKKYAFAQGRNLKIDISDKKKCQRVGVRCVEGCPFRIYGSWEHNIASYIVKGVVSTHKCQRNMNKNRQLKSSWCAEQLITTFKSRPHVPSAEIVDLVREKFKIIIS